jgi:hypothetical protein
MLRRGALAIVVAIIGSCCSEADDAARLLDETRSHHHAAIEAIHSLYCKHTFKCEYSNGRVEVTPQSEYWRSANLVRAKWRTEDSWCDIVIKDLEVESLCKFSGKTKPIVTIRRDEGSALGMADPWLNALFVFFGEPNPSELPGGFDKLLIGHKIQRVENVVRGEEDFNVIELKIGSSIREYSFDRHRNYLIRKVATSAGSDSSTSEVVRFTEAAPGIYFPEIVILKVFSKGALDQTRASTFADIRVNMPIPDAGFRLEYPPSTEVHDLIRGKQFTTDGSGQIAGEGTDLAVPPPTVSSRESGPPRAQTTTEASSWLSWILPVSVCLLLVGACFWCSKRLRMRLGPHQG